MKNFTLDANTEPTFKYDKVPLNGREFFYLGNETLLQKKKIGIFISREIPLNIIVPVEQFLFSVIELPYVFISGWHSPFERRILKKILAQGKEVIFFTSKGIKNQGQYRYLKEAINDNKLLIGSLIEDKATITLHNSIVRNEAIGDIAEHNLFMFINKDGNLEKLFNKLLSQNKIPLVLNHSANSSFLQKGKPIGMENFKEALL